MKNLDWITIVKMTSVIIINVLVKHERQNCIDIIPLENDGTDIICLYGKWSLYTDEYRNQYYSPFLSNQRIIIHLWKKLFLFLIILRSVLCIIQMTAILEALNEAKLKILYPINEILYWVMVWPKKATSVWCSGMDNFFLKFIQLFIWLYFG